MSEQKKRLTKEEIDRIIPPISPDDPLFRRGWIVGGRIGGPRPKSPPVLPPQKKPGDSK